MNKSRITFKGALHHIMNRGIKGNNILENKSLKNTFINLMLENAKKIKIDIYAYCIMDNHYHILLENSSGELSKFMQIIDGNFAILYRKIYGGKGYVFQNRFKSILIDRDRYFRMAILYVLLNPIRKGIVNSAFDYKFSSINEYFTKNKSTNINNVEVEALFYNKDEFIHLLNEWSYVNSLKSTETFIGNIWGDEKFVIDSLKYFDRRKEEKKDSPNMREKDIKLKDINELVCEFEKQFNLSIENIDIKTDLGRALRNELLYFLKKNGHITYKEINKLKPFKNLKFSTLGKLFKRIQNAKMPNPELKHNFKN